MTDETNDEEEKTKKPILKSIDDYVHPDETEKVVDFQKVKDEREDQEEKPKLKSKFDFMNGDDFILFKAEQHETLEVHCHVFINLEDKIPEGMNYHGPSHVQQCIGFKRVTRVNPIDWFLGVYSLESKFEKIATMFSNEMKEKLSIDEDMNKFMNKFSL